MANVLALIPARGGSKGVPEKNLRELLGSPLLAYSVVAAARTRLVNRIVVTTDDDKIAEAARRFGAEAPFRRPVTLAGDLSQDVEYVKHALDWFECHENWQPELVMLLRPTTPLRDPDVLDQAIQVMQTDLLATSLRSAHPLNEPPQKMLQIKNNRFTGFFPDDDRADYFNLPRQNFPQAYHPNGYVDIVRSAHLKKTGKLYGAEIRPLVTAPVVEIDTLEDLNFLEWHASRQKIPLLGWVAQARPYQTN